MKKILPLGTLILLSLACSLFSTNGSGAGVTATPTPTPAEILFKAGYAMLDMKSARFSLVREGEPIQLDPAGGMSFNEASGEYQAPDRVRATVKVKILASVVNIEVYWLPEGVFISNPLTQKIVPANTNLGIDGAALFGADGMPKVLAAGIEDPVRIGAEDIEGVATIHIRGESDGAVLAPVTAGSLQSGTLYPVDVWVDSSTFIPVRMHVTESETDGWLIDLYDIDGDITVQLPQE